MKTNRLCHGCAAACVPVITALFLGLFATAGSEPVDGRQPGHGISQANPAVQRVRQIYTSQIGIREKQPNSGPAVEEYLRYVGLPKGNPWCAAFVCWVLGKAGVENPGTGWSPGLFPVNKVIWERKKEWTMDSGQWTMRKDLKDERGKVKEGSQLNVENGKLKAGGGVGSIAVPLTGDVFGIYFQEKKRIAHVGFVDQWDGTWVVTVEGNTNMSGSREGDGVYRKRRLVGSIYKVARYGE